ncbi:MAG TPA: lysis protein, partial [Pseudomonas sp.]|uniref:lysis protein n=1 Tax=Pseudomonas sp. TaxID=306 RepID=UPI002EDAE9AB
MAAVVEVLRKYWVVLLAFTWVLATLFALMAGDRNGYARGQTEGEILIAKLREEQADQRAQTAEQNLQQYRQQVAKANLAEEQLLIAQDELAKAKKQLSERIPHVTTVYRPARSAAPVPIPRPVFTCGWLRDFNTALGASVSVPAACTAAAGVAE